MPSKRTLKKQLRELQDLRIDLGYAVEGREREVAKLKDELAKANESWAKEKKRADENHRLLQQAREAHQRLHEALYPGARSPNKLGLLGGAADPISGALIPINAIQDARQEAADTYANKDRETL